MTHLTLPRWTALYELPAKDYAEASESAHAIAVEQTIEYPYELVEGTWFADEITGQVEMVSPLKNGKWQARISYPTEAVQGEFVEFLNMLYGNTSLHIGVRLLDFELSDDLVKEYSGAKFGLEGLRKYWHVPVGPLLMAVLKPIGHTTKEFAEMARQFAAGGFHIVKDDHSLHNQIWSPYEERVKTCVDTIAETNAKTGNQCAYVPNVMAQGSELLKRAYFAQEQGANGVMMSPSIAGWGMVRELSSADDFHLPIVLHPSYSGPFIRSGEAGMLPKIYNGYLPRMAGADSVIFTGGGRFPASKGHCKETQMSCIENWSNLPPIMPAIGGGVYYEAIPELAERFGNDIMFLVGGDLFRPGPDLVANAHRFRAEVERIYGLDN